MNEEKDSRRLMPNDDSARTMRIDIRPSEADRKDAVESLHQPGDEHSFQEKKEGGTGRSEEYRKLLQCIYDGVFITDLDGCILDYNDRVAELLLAEGADLSGAMAIDFISGAGPNLLGAIMENLKSQRYTLIEGKVICFNGTMFPAEIAVNKLDLDERGQLCFFVRNISIRKKVQEDLEKAVARLEQHDRARAQFVSNVSHELRTPLTSMIYAVSNLLRGVAGPVSSKVRRYLELLEGDCKRLLGTVNDILDLRKIESNELQLAKTKAPFATLVSESVESLRFQAREKLLYLDVAFERRNFFVECDPQKMERVIFNVLGNAIKFTQAGGEIHVELAADPDRPSNVRISIRDTGIGIPPEALKKVTVRYFTVGEQPSGSGLGLAIAKEIVELHGGKLDISSPPAGFKRGTQVDISLPTVEAPLVMVVDDEPHVASALKADLEEAGYRVTTASTGEEALAKASTDKPEAIILDLVLPDMEGTAVILNMKGDKHLRRIPVIAITGAGVNRTKSEILRNFSIPLVSKPWQEEELVDRVDGACLGVAVLGQGRRGGEQDSNGADKEPDE